MMLVCTKHIPVALNQHSTAFQLNGVIGPKSSWTSPDKKLQYVVKVQASPKAVRPWRVASKPEGSCPVGYCIYLPLCCQLLLINLAVSIPPALSSVIQISELKPFLSHFPCLLLLNPSFLSYLSFPHTSISATTLEAPSHTCQNTQVIADCSPKITLPTNVYHDRKGVFQGTQ